MFNRFCQGLLLINLLLGLVIVPRVRSNACNCGSGGSYNVFYNMTCGDLGCYGFDCLTQVGLCEFLGMSMTGYTCQYCVQCPPGKYVVGGQSTSCTQCPAGTYNEHYGGTAIDNCTICQAGTFSSAGLYVR